MLLQQTGANQLDVSNNLVPIRRELSSSMYKFMMTIILTMITMWMMFMLTSTLAQAQCSHLQPTILVIMGMPGYSSVSEFGAQVTIMAVIVECTCVNTDSSSGHYTCGSNGEKRCLTGWSNPSGNCLTRTFWSQSVWLHM